MTLDNFPLLPAVRDDDLAPSPFPLTLVVTLVVFSVLLLVLLITLENTAIILSLVPFTLVN